MLKTRGLLVLLVLTANAASATEATPTAAEFVTQFYKSYLSKGARKSLPTKLFFSSAVMALLKQNAENCRIYSRGDDVCGYGANSDIYLAAQANDPSLTFAAKGFTATNFTATNVEPGVVDATFKLGPRPDHLRRVRLYVVQEAGAWRVDDLNFRNSLGQLIASQRLRTQVAAENETLKGKGGLQNVWSSVLTYVRQGVADRFARFVADQLELCPKTGACTHVSSRDNKQLTKLVATLRAMDRAKPFTEQIPADGIVGPFVFTQTNDVWWVSKIDLSR